MISRIYVMLKTGASRADSYLIDSKFSKKELIKLAEALTNPILENYYINQSPKVGDFSFAVEIGFKPGVTDNIGSTVKEIAKDLLHAQVEVFTSKIFFVSGSKKSAEEFASTLYNPLIERAVIVPVKNRLARGRAMAEGKINLPLKAPKVVLKKRKPVISVPLNVSDEELTKIGREGIMDPDGTRRGPLALDLSSMHAIRDYFNKLPARNASNIAGAGGKRNPTDIELESLAQTWSEHCKHTIFANPIDDIQDGLYKTYIKGA